jgi:hypothetical protein
MEKGGLYNRGSILLSKSKKSVNKNHTFAVSFRRFLITSYRIRKLMSKQMHSRESKKRWQ